MNKSYRISPREVLQLRLINTDYRSRIKGEGAFKEGGVNNFLLLKTGGVHPNLDLLWTHVYKSLMFLGLKRTFRTFHAFFDLKYRCDCSRDHIVLRGSCGRVCCCALHNKINCLYYPLHTALTCAVVCYR